MKIHRLAAPIAPCLLLLACKAATTAPEHDASVVPPMDAGAMQDADADAGLLVAPELPRDASEDSLADLRDACAFGAGAWPAETIGNDYPVGTDIPINHIIVIMQENRSFDHYYGHMVAEGLYDAGDFTTTEAGPGPGFADNGALDGPPPGWSVPDSDGGPVFPHPDNGYCFGVNHSWEAEHFDYDNGLNDGFVKENNPGGSLTMFYEDNTVIPFYHALASTFSVGDRYFCSVLTSTWPNRYFMMAGTSYGIADNSYCDVDTAAHPAPQIFSLLEQAGHTWKDYTDGPHQILFYPYFSIEHSTPSHLGNVACDLMTDIQNNTLPDVAYVMGDEVTETSDEGPSNLPGVGARVVETIIRNLWASPAWKDTVVFINYDENGGMADHVPPPPACVPDSYTPHYGGDGGFPDGGFDRLGFRVPFTVVSPYAKAHYVSHVVHDHTSVLRFIEARFGLPALTARDANAIPPMEMFDFKNPPFMTPPNITATTTIPDAILSQCNQKYAPIACDGGT